MTEPAASGWRWVSHGWTYHLARKTHGNRWVLVCQALTTWPFSATPERIKLNDGTEVWALRQKVREHPAYGNSIRVNLPRRQTCGRCRAHAKEIARLWRGAK